MPLRRVYVSHCPECGHVLIGRIEGDWIWLRGSGEGRPGYCSCDEAPGPPDPPQVVPLRDIIWPSQEKPDASSQ